MLCRRRVGRCGRRAARRTTRRAARRRIALRKRRAADDRQKNPRRSVWSVVVSLPLSPPFPFPEHPADGERQPPRSCCRVRSGDVRPVTLRGYSAPTCSFPSPIASPFRQRRTAGGRAMTEDTPTTFPARAGHGTIAEAERVLRSSHPHGAAAGRGVRLNDGDGRMHCSVAHTRGNGMRDAEYADRRSILHRQSRASPGSRRVQPLLAVSMVTHPLRSGNGPGRSGGPSTAAKRDGRKDGGMGGKSRHCREPSLHSAYFFPPNEAGSTHRAGRGTPCGSFIVRRDRKGEMLPKPSSGWQSAPTFWQPVLLTLPFPVSKLLCAETPFFPRLTYRFDGRSLLSCSINKNRRQLFISAEICINYSTQDWAQPHVGLNPSGL